MKSEWDEITFSWDKMKLNQNEMRQNWDRSFHSEWGPASVCLMKYFKNSIAISSFVKSFSDVTTVMSKSISEKSQSDIIHFSCMIINEDDDFLSVTSIALIIVRDCQFSELKE